MAVHIIMPKAGMSMEEGTIVKWFKKEGDIVEKGEPLLEILTDKVNMEIESPCSGVLLKILKSEGEVVPVTNTIAYIGEADEKVGDSIKAGMKEASADINAGAKTSADIYDVIVIGGGPAGYVSAIKAAQLGGRVALIEKDTVGGTCLNRGCIPTKTYLKNAEIVSSLKHAGERGIVIDNSSLNFDMEKVVLYKNNVVRKLTTGVSALLNSYGVKVYKGVGKVTKDKKVIINNSEIIEAKNVILAGGSKAAKINIPGIESSLVLTSDEILDLKEIPKNLVIIGGGVIGVEMAIIFNTYGSQVTIVEMADRIVPFMDKDISEELNKVLKRKKIKVMTSTKLSSFEEKSGKIYVSLEGKEPLEADKVLISIGRVPDLEAVSEIEIEMERGKIKVNEKMETSIKGIYAPGDINGQRMLAHAAFKMGEVAAANAMGKDEKINMKYVPSCIYTIPEVGAVGLTEEEARVKYDISVGRFPFGANGRALASGEGMGFVKVIIDKKYGEILGVHIIGPSAAEIINEAAALMDMEITAYEVSEIIHGHPTFSEAFMEAVADSLGKCIHLPKNEDC